MRKNGLTVLAAVGMLLGLADAGRAATMAESSMAVRERHAVGNVAVLVAILLPAVRQGHSVGPYDSLGAIRTTAVRERHAVGPLQGIAVRERRAIPVLTGGTPGHSPVSPAAPDLNAGF